MKILALLAAGLMAMAAAGCATHGKQTSLPPAPTPLAAPAAAAEPLSVSQTQIQLPPAQPLDPQALVVETPPSPAPAPAPVPQTPGRRPNVAAQPRPEPPVPVTAEIPKPAIQEVLPEAKRNQLQEAATSIRKQVTSWLNANPPQRFSGAARQKRDKIQSYLIASDKAEQRGDMSEAAELAGRAELLMKEFLGGR